MHEHFTRFAAYNRWANQRLYDAAAQLSDAQYREDCQVFFNSMQGTLNHILVADTVWMGRFQNTEHSITGLNDILHEDHADLTKARLEMDQRIADYVGSLDQATLEADFTYTPVTSPDPVTMQLAIALSHVFNHQTHHRGHAHAVLTRLGADAPPLDLIYFQIEQQNNG
ncbi:MAG: damage-inducible protein DinB [Rhizobiaceae bacterium]|nr:DinB family protein [Hyphomicrobiales bacterium]NRB31563.1 damage-inducible protein DinB [Rhizobiaceae bacterium]